MPEKRFEYHSNYHPWISEYLRHLIKLRQRAYFTGNKSLFKYYRNIDNRKRKTCESLYYKTNVDVLKQCNSRHWWREGKRINGQTSHSRLHDCIQSENLELLSPVELANAINIAFLEPMQESCPFILCSNEFESEEFPDVATHHGRH